MRAEASGANVTSFTSRPRRARQHPLEPMKPKVRREGCAALAGSYIGDPVSPVASTVADAAYGPRG